MKKKLFTCLFALLFCFLLIGCTKKEDGPFKMECTGKKDKNEAMESQTVIVYTFNKEQIATEFTTTTTQTFEDKETYETYKKTQEESSKQQAEGVTFSLKTNDDKKELVFIMTMKGIDKDAKTNEDKEKLKASYILNENEESNTTCVLKGIKKEELK